MAKKRATPSTRHQKLASELGIEIAQRLLRRLPSMAEAIAEGAPSASFTATVKITDSEATVNCKGSIPLAPQEFKVKISRGQLELFEGQDLEDEPAIEEEAPLEDDDQEEEPERDAEAGRPPKGASQVEAPRQGRKPRKNVKSVSRRQSGGDPMAVPALRGDGMAGDDEDWGDDDDGYIPDPKNAHLADEL